MDKLLEVSSCADQPLRTDGDVDLSTEAIAALESHPAFADVVRRVSAATAEGYRSRWVLNRLLNDGGRFIASLMMLDLHFAAGKGEGFTAAQLRREAVDGGLCSAGRITAFLASLRLAGFLAAGPTRDRRTRQLVPTEALLATHRERWRTLFDLMAELCPDARGASDALEDPAFIGHCAHVMMESYRGGERLLAHAPELAPIGQRDAGITMLMSLLTLEPGESASITALARCFSVSRSHVRETLRIAEQAGLACATAQRGHFTPGPHLAAVIGRFYTILFLVYRHAFVLAAERGWRVGAAYDPSRTPSALAPAPTL